MNAIETMQGLLFERLGIYVPKNEIAVEGVQLYADEIDEAIVPSEMLVGIKQPILAEMASYRDENDVEYLLIQLEIGRGKIHEVWLVNDEVVDVKRDINK